MQKKSHNNNFDFVRILAALTVLYSHHFALFGLTEPAFYSFYTFGGAAVIVFFAISGYLVTGSILNDRNFIRFLLKRILRIWPALIFTILSTTFILGPSLTNIKIEDYFNHPTTLNYLKSIFLNMQFSLPGVFEKNPLPYNVNGSLWTIPLEVRCYTIVAFLGLIGVVQNRILLNLSILLILLTNILTSSADIYEKVDYGREFTSFFLVGSLLFLNKEIIKNKYKIFLTVIISIISILCYSNYKNIAFIIFMPLVIIYLGKMSTPFFSKFGKYGDPSYGIYLFAFPTQQTIIFFYKDSLGFYPTMLLSAVICIFFAYASWHLLEKQFLKLANNKKHEKLQRIKY